MKIDDDHMYHGAALTQIAEHPQFTAINRLTTATGGARSTFRINHNIGIYLKYATSARRPYLEYQFTFVENHLQEIDEIAAKVERAFVVLVCVRAREICCLSAADLRGLVQRRQGAVGFAEDQCTVIATLPKNKKVRVYVNQPNKKGAILGNPLLIARKSFPSVLFE